MLRFAVYTTLLFSILLMIGPAAFGQQVITGLVTDAETGKPIPYASVGILGTSQGTSTNLNGEFSLAVQKAVLIKFSCVGYESLSIMSDNDLQHIRLKPTALQLDEVYVTSRKLNPAVIVRRALNNISHNYSRQGFLQKFFYRHYCKDDSVYGRLIEATVEVWKHNGYRATRRKAGDNEEIRVTQLRRSLDRTEMAQGHEPISVGNILQADVAGYQQPENNNPYLRFFEEASNLKAGMEHFQFELAGVTTLDRQAVYKINYSYRQDSILTNAGYVPAPQVKGTLFITMDNFAIVKTEEVKTDGPNVIRTSAYYQKFNNKYYPYHFIREGESRFEGNHMHSTHIELMSVEIRQGSGEKFKGSIPGKEELLAIPYDSVYWSTNTTLKTTPLEDEIISDLGGGTSLNRQFYRYQKYEWSASDGGNQAEEKFYWFRDFNKEKKMLYLIFWNSDCDLACLVELEKIKLLQNRFRTHMAVVMLSLEDDSARWQQFVSKYNLFANGIINYRIGSRSEIARSYHIRHTPGFVLILKSGEIFQAGQRATNIPFQEAEIETLTKRLQ
jgi:hypothetical protein